jgi:hypothetical protein
MSPNGGACLDGAAARDDEQRASARTRTTVTTDTTGHSDGAPRYEDRETGARYANPLEMVNAYLARLAEASGHELSLLDATGYAQIKRGSAHLGINVLEENGVLMLLAPIMQVPVGRREALYRRLLELSFLATGEASFAIDGSKDVVYVRALRRLSGLDYEEFLDLVQTVGGLADEHDTTLPREFGE